jgi:flagellin-like hook-associated protein FlgL
MNKETYQYKLDDIYARKDELKKYKETFQINIEKLFSDFKKDSFTPFYEQLKQNIIYIFDDYKNNAEEKIKESNKEVNAALQRMKEEIDKKIKEADESYKLKQENLKIQINIQKEKIGDVLIENNLFLGGATLKNNSIKNEEVEPKEIVGPTTITGLSLGVLSGVVLAIIDTVGLAAFVELTTVAGLTFGGIGAIFGAVVGVAGFGVHKAWKYYHKKEDLIKSIEKAKNDFMPSFDKFYSDSKNILDEDKKKIIDSFCNSIDIYISKMDKILNEMEKN